MTHPIEKIHQSNIFVWSMNLRSGVTCSDSRDRDSQHISEQIRGAGAATHRRYALSPTVYIARGLDHYRGNILRHTLRDNLLAILRETSSPRKVFFHQGKCEVDHNYRSFPKPLASQLDQHHPCRSAVDKTLSDPFCGNVRLCR
jgi:hypothetical protein